MLAGDDKRRHRLHAHLAAVHIARAYIVNVSVTGQQFCHKGSIHACAIGNISKGFHVTDIAAFNEISLEQLVDDEQLMPFDPGPVNEAMGVQGVWRALDRVEINRQSLGLGPLNDGCICFDRAVFATKFGFKVFMPIHAIQRHIRI